MQHDGHGTNAVTGLPDETAAKLAHLRSILRRLRLGLGRLLRRRRQRPGHGRCT